MAWCRPALRGLWIPRRSRRDTPNDKHRLRFSAAALILSY